MNQTVCKLTVFFDDPFWVGALERQDHQGYQVCRIIFGPEPRDYQVYDFLNRNWRTLRFSPCLSGDAPAERSKNPKRLQREIHKQMENTGIGTKAQQALKLQQEQNKLERKCRSRALKESEKELRFEQKQQKRKEKHQGH